MRGRIDVRNVRQPPRSTDADQDAHPRRRRAFRQAAGRAHRPRGAADAAGGGAQGGGAAARRHPVVALRRAAGVRLRHRPRHRAAGRRGAAHASRARPAAAARAHRLALRPAEVPRDDDVHAERVGGRAAPWRDDRRERARCSRRRGASCCGAPPRAACSSRAAAAAWRCSSRIARRVHIPIFGSDQIADVTGAGDTVIATMTLALAAGATLRRGGAPGQLRRRPRGDEARHGHGHQDELKNAIRA